MSWADNFNTFEEACIYYGADTPAQIEAELEYYHQLDMVETQDQLEAHGGAAARSHALGASMADWTRREMGRDPSDGELVRSVLWGSQDPWLRSTSPLPSAPDRQLYPDDDIPF